MHVLMLVLIGLVVLVGFVAGARLLFGCENGKLGAQTFTGAWLLASLVNGAVGIFYAGIPLLNEIGAFIPIFGIPAGAAWYLSRREGAPAS